ncbi:MAG TPA: DUF1801 domain-containing protein [Chitinophagaceae bacterium]|nr:DUF1801 domain-containing protein [Chitinophagaceae bacterium]
MKIEEILSNYDEPVASLALQVRNFLLKELKNITEIPDPAAKMIAYGYGPGYTDMICTILLSKREVKLGFYKGSELPDPASLLTGTGKVHRFVEIKTAQDLKNPALEKLIGEARKAYEKRKNN